MSTAAAGATPQVARMLPPRGTLLVAALWMAVWVAGAFMTEGDRGQALVLAVAQGMLALLTLEILRVALPPARSRTGLYVLPVLVLHVVLYYGVFNVIPALLIEWRPSYSLFGGTDRIPEAPISAYLAATWAAASFVVGVAFGTRLAYGLMQKHARALPNRSSDVCFPWLPGYRTSLAIAVGLAGVVLLATARYGVQYGQMLVDADQLAALPFVEQLLFHGVIPFLPFPAVLAAVAILTARTRQERRWGVAAFVVLAVFNIGALLVWGMRSAAIFVFLLPMALFVYTGRIRWQKLLLPAVTLGALVYGVVTIARISALDEQLGQDTPFTLGTAGGLVDAGVDKELVFERFLSDMSYRTSGLEPVAAIVDGQDAGVLRPMGGRVVFAGLTQALPAGFRSQPEFPDQIKTAPSQYGWFVSGDWVTTPLSELVMDVGPWLVVLPAIGVGLLLALFDEALLMLGQQPALRPLLVVRLAWLVTVLDATSLAGLTLMFVKATIGYSLLFLALGALARLGRRRDGPVDAPVSG